MINLKAKYFYTRVLFQLISNGLYHKNDFKVFCSTDDANLEASETFRNGIRRCFDLVMLTHG